MRLSLPLRVLVAASCGVLSSTPVRAAAVQYRLDFASNPLELAVRVCLREAHPSVRFVLPERDAARHLVDATRDPDRALERKGNVLRAHDWRDGECLAYRADLRGVAAGGTRGPRPRDGADLLLPTRAWLWRPAGLAGDDDIELRVELPQGCEISVPWAPLDCRTAPSLPARRLRPVLAGHGRAGALSSGATSRWHGGALRLALTGELAPTQQQTITRHVREAAGDVLASFPPLLAARPQLLVVPVPGAREAVPFGQSLRGGGTGLMLYVDPRATLADFRASWTLTHELVHLAHPYLGDEGRWIAEGLATWYQNVLRARAGRISADQAWRHIAAGIGRGIADPADLSLRDTSRAGAGRHTMRLYWSGTALMMLGDIALRTRNGSPASLDLALSRYLACCRARDVRRWPRSVPRRTRSRGRRRHAGAPVPRPRRRQRISRCRRGVAGARDQRARRRHAALRRRAISGRAAQCHHGRRPRPVGAHLMRDRKTTPCRDAWLLRSRMRCAPTGHRAKPAAR